MFCLVGWLVVLPQLKGRCNSSSGLCTTSPFPLAVYNRMYVDNQLRKPEVVLASSLTQTDPPSSESPSSLPTITIVLLTIGVFIIIAFTIVGGAALYRHSQNAEDAPSATEAGRPTSARYSPANVQETGDKTTGERRSQRVLRGMCDPRGWFSQVDHDSVHGEETPTGRQGTQQLALLGGCPGWEGKRGKERGRAERGWEVKREREAESRPE